MSLQTIRIAPPNSLVFVMDDREGAVPDDTGEAPIVATASCVAVGTLMEHDGETEIRLSGPEDFVPSAGLSLSWSGTIATAGTLDISTSWAEVLLSVRLPEGKHRPVVTIWTNDSHEPDLIWVVVGRPARRWTRGRPRSRVRWGRA